MAEDKNIQSERIKALEASILSIEKEFGKGAIMKLGSRKAISIDYIPSGSLLLDAALGIGGYPRGRVVEISFEHASAIIKIQTINRNMHLVFFNYVKPSTIQVALQIM